MAAQAITLGSVLSKFGRTDQVESFAIALVTRDDVAHPVGACGRLTSLHKPKCLYCGKLWRSDVASVTLPERG